MSQLQQRLLEERKAMNVRQQDMAEQLGVPTTTYGGWEQGRVEPGVDMLIKLADIFECSIDYLVGRASALDVVNITTDLSAQQKELLQNFDKLNTEGKARLLGYLLALLGMPLYARK